MYKLTDNQKYKDIINMPHFVSERRKHMSITDRAAQFAPFAALTGYEDGIIDAGRYTVKKIEMCEEEISILNEKLRYVLSVIESSPKVTLTFFVKDCKKTGGKYITITDNVKKIDDFEKKVIFESDISVDIDTIYKIEGDIFDKLAFI